ncbi:threonine synthase, partial [Candidatus Pelagibacter sp.]|nr:threonine synthase [Candidatus Pelagibacter sp.]
IKNEKLKKINKDFLSARMSEQETLNVIKNIHEKFNIVLDPHTAIGYGAFDKNKLKGNNIVLATAHPCKFPDAILKAINLKSDLPEELKFILEAKENYGIIENNLNEIKQYILGKVK